MKKLNKKEAIRLIPPVVDNEASEEERIAFFKYIQKNEDIKKKYESMLFVKQLLKTKYSRDNAPAHLREKISGIIEDMEWEKEQESKVDNASSYLSESDTFIDTEVRGEQPAKQTAEFILLKPARYLAAASVIFIFSLLTIEFLEEMSSERIFTQNSVEQVALSHFTSGSHIEASLASYQTNSLDHASQLLKDEMSYSPRLPKIEGAELRKIMHTTFSDGYTVPVLEFYQDEINESIHVFAFKVDDLEKIGAMERDQDAVKSCKTYNDYHIKEINGKHVVSWKWGNYWYTAVSNHNGNDLIALVEPNLTEQEINSDDSSW